MKNFTNNFKQFTSRLSARWLIMALMMLVGTSSAWAANLYIYSTSSSAKAWIWVEGGSNYTGGNWNSRPALSNTTYFESLGNNIYRYKKQTLPSSVSIILTPSGGSPEARIDNLSLSSNKYLSYSGGNTITQVTPSSYTRYVAGGTAGDSGGTDNVFGTRWEAAGATNKMTWDDSKCLFVKEYITNESSSITLTFKITNGTWNSSWPASNKTQSVSSGCRKTTITYNIFTNAVNSTSASSTECCTTVDAPDVTSNGPICAGSTATLTLNNRQEGVTYKLNSTTGTTIFTSGNNTYTTPALNANTTYKIYASHASACTNNVEGSVTVSLKAAPTKPAITLNPADGKIVAGNSATLTVTEQNDVTFTLYKEGVTTNKTGNSFTISEEGTYHVVGKNSCGVSSPDSDKKTITVCTPNATLLSATYNQQTDKIDLSGNLTETCGKTIYYGFLWKVKGDDWNTNNAISGTGNSYNSTSTNNTAFNQSWANAEDATTYVFTAYALNTATNPDTWYYDETGIEVSKCITVATPDIDPVAICAGSTATLTLNNKQDGVTYTLDDDTPIFTDGTTHTVNPDRTTTYTITATSANSCDADQKETATVTVTVNELPDAPVLGKTEETVCPNTQFTLPTIDGKWYAQEKGGSAYVSNTITNGVAATTYYYAEAVKYGCSSATRTRYTVNVHTAPVKPTISFSPNPVAQNKPTTLTVGGYNSTLNDYTLYKDGESQGACTASQETTISEDNEYEYYVVATSKACPSLTATSETVTLEVQEAGVKIIQLGDLKLYTNIITDFVPMYVQKDGIVDVAGATAVKGYTWQFSANGTSDWANCTTNYADKAVGMTNGTAACNNWRADKVGYYRCLISYEGSNETQTSNALQVTGTTGTAPAINAFANFDMPVISINTGSKSLPDECSVVGKNYPSTNIDGMKKKISVDVRIYNPDGTLQYDRKGRINYRGSSSLNFKKKSYAFVTGKEKTKNSDGDVDTGKANLFGLSDGAKDKDWVLYAATPDPSMMRNRLVFDLYKEMTGKWGVNSMYVELIINNEYKGVYVLMDKITMNEKRVNITDYNGFIVKFDKTDKVDRVENTEGDQKTFATTRTGKKDITTYDTKVDQLFEIEYPEKEDIEDEGGNWTSVYKIIQERFEEFETALYNKEYEKVRQLIDYNSWADWFIINEYTKNLDAYRASCLFVYNGDKIEAQPLWDQELSFNNVTANISAKNAHSTDGLLIKDSGVYSDNFKAPFWFTGGGTNITGGLLNDPCFVSTVKSKWAAYTAEGGVLTTANISKKVAAFAEELDDAIDRENAMLPFNDNTAAGRGATSSCTGSKAMGYYGYGANCGAATTHEGSKGAITTWITNRIPKLTAELDKLTGQPLIFILSPANAETTPWKGVNINVQAPEGYEYTLSHDELDADGAIISESGHMLNIRIPRPSDWGTGGNGTAHSKQYKVKATIEVSGENACGTVDNNEATANIILMDVTEDCNPEIVKK